MRHARRFRPAAAAALLSGLAACAGLPADRGASLAVARVALQHGSADSALRIAEDLAAAAPDDPARLSLLGDAEAALGRLPLAEAAYKHALEVDPASVDAALGLARIELATDAPRARTRLVGLAARVPHDARVLTDLGVAEDLGADTSAAQSHYRQALTLDPSLVSAQADLGLSLALSGHAAEGLRILAPLAASPASTARLRQDYAAAAALAGREDVAAAALDRDLSVTDRAAALQGFQALAERTP